MTHDPDEDEGDDFYNAALDFLSIAAQHLPPEPDNREEPGQ